MGVDALDISFRLEREFHLSKVTREWSTLGRLYDGRPDVTAGDLAALVTRMLGLTPPDAPESPAVPPVPVAGGPTLGYESRLGGPWPEPPPFDPAVWPGVCRVLAASLGVDAGDIVPQSRLIRDLGMC
jgi:hypothetical protein